MSPERGFQPFHADWRSAVPGLAWPAIGSDRAAHLLSLLFQLERSQWQTAEAIRARQLVQLACVLRHAVASVPYYADQRAAVGCGDVDWASFAAWPLLARSSLQQQFDGLSSRQVPASHGQVSCGQTSGSTAMPLSFLGTDVTRLFWEALTLREHFWHRRDFAQKQAAIRVNVERANARDWGVPVASAFNSGPAVMLNVRTDIGAQLDWLQAENPGYLISHASNLGALAELSRRRGVRLPALRQARTFSETLRPDLRACVREAWGVEVADVYSCSEAGVIALQCPGYEHYHVQAENLIVEILQPDGRPCVPGETGEVVLTTLHNFAMPLIRYRLGDYAELGEPCPCGRGLPVLKRIHGRQRNMLQLPDGQTRWPSFPAATWTEIAPVEQFQLVQRAIDRIEARYVMGRDLNDDEVARLRVGLQGKLGYPIGIDFRRVERIERMASHKFEDFISELPPATAQR